MKIFYTLFALLLIFTTSSVNAATIPKSGVLDFTVVRKDKDIGRHIMHFQKEGEETKITIKTRIKVKILMVTVYHFKHDATELWENGHLIEMHSQTDDDGTKHKMAVSTQGTKLLINVDGRNHAEINAIIPASLWNKDMVKQFQILNTLDGQRMNIKTTHLGTKNIIIGNQKVMVDHYQLRGDLNRDLWYTPAGLLVKVSLKGSDGTEVQYVLR